MKTQQETGAPRESPSTKGDCAPLMGSNALKLRGRMANLQLGGRGFVPRCLRCGRFSIRLSHWEFVNKSVSIELYNNYNAKKRRNEDEEQSGVPRDNLHIAAVSPTIHAREYPLIFPSAGVCDRPGRRATVAERLARSSPTKANRTQSPAGSPDFHKCESCRTMPLVGGFSQGSPAYPAPSFRRRSIFTSITLIGSKDLAVRRRPNLFTYSLQQGKRKHPTPLVVVAHSPHVNTAELASGSGISQAGVVRILQRYGFYPHHISSHQQLDESDYARGTTARETQFTKQRDYHALCNSHAAFVVSLPIHHSSSTNTELHIHTHPTLHQSIDISAKEQQSHGKDAGMSHLPGLVPAISAAVPSLHALHEITILAGTLAETRVILAKGALLCLSFNLVLPRTCFTPTTTRASPYVYYEQPPSLEQGITYKLLLVVSGSNLAAVDRFPYS
ncbi:hypothetical protein PR048_001039 [Dryococelus australis]|uniref:Uncharacterized protein n=1 Tax=Dryococelus australis TaxID=614101 RepID=A0ABQ9IIP5_9NEOP|nr:hypothetical protein PR048_001039 [Dryococelus australis]